MNAESNSIKTYTPHPARVNGDAIHALAQWLKANDSRQPDLRSLMNDRYPVGLFSEDEMKALCELARN
ncbi:hypothetical protein [Pseudomonas trivialis]|uniref:Uncharacterized protein n=1 Tax=Pseudomonas trivialis TaxID=200450 RepID=A0A0R2ZGA6_9PSED|nr:hypothetical protein [Pseudomonas trivialis]KRP59831.1 hypothetical protein TU79_14460 [Pseudomonas trivialis]SDS16025.1 hypothetical protein SAMN04490205_1663 [Pseudomonas trivialis]